LYSGQWEEQTMLDELQALREEALARLGEANTAAALEQWRLDYLGKKGKLTAMLRGLGGLPAAERPARGRSAARPPTMSRMPWKKPAPPAPRRSSASNARAHSRLRR
jgi:phenylalanyl-tRNA synthetase alpha subunit